jgi:drug/metabolite transporter (DMT)-like permease
MPFRYTGLVWSLILGAAIWGNFPNALALLGMAVIAGAGLASIQRKGNQVTVGQHTTPVMPETDGRQDAKA